MRCWPVSWRANERRRTKTNPNQLNRRSNMKNVDLITNEDVRTLENYWRNDPRWRGVTRNYSAENVLRLRGTLKIEHTVADQTSRKLWALLNREPYVNALGALTGNQAVQMVEAGLKAIYLSGWQVAADNNLAGAMN